jgi:hypothetical protein
MAEKTEITFNIGRTIKTAEFESLHVSAEVKESFEWDGEKERSEKMQKVADHVLEDFRKSYNLITESIGVKRSIGTGKLENKITKETKTANVEADDCIDLFDEIDMS